MNKEQYIMLSELFVYPKWDYKLKVGKCMEYLETHYPDAASSLERFNNFVQSNSLYDIEEIFGVTFHIQAICFLDIGYVLFREDYSRGEFLVNMKQEQAKIGHDCGEELADNLPHVLKLMAISNDEEFINELTVRAVIPALEQMLNEFQTKRMEARKNVIKKKQKAMILEDVANGNIYQNALQALLKVLHKDFEGVNYSEREAILSPSLVGFSEEDCGSCSFTSSTNKTIKT
ncbi:MAG: hypothetical protein KDB74_08395 [Flavobacteriales bacterium]|nr:hypothetical protein [Flavobacteriales bacterium]